MMTPMAGIARQSQATPEFVDLCKALYGDVIDAQDVWDDVFKASPDSADVSSHSGNTGPIDRGRLGMRGLAITGGVLGGALGVREGIHGAREYRVARKIGAKIPGSAKKKLAVSGLLSVADSVDLGVLATEKVQRHPSRSQLANKGKLVPVDKGLGSVSTEVLGGARKMKTGLLRMWNPTKFAPRPSAAGAPKVTAATKKIATANNAGAAKATAQGKDVGTMLGTKSGKVATGALGVIGANKAAKARSRGGMEYVDDGMSKSDETVFRGEFSKFDEDKHLAFGWASVVSKGGHPVIDKQGDYIAIDDIEKAAYSYVIKSRVGGDNHTRAGEAAFKASDMVESMVFTDDKIAKMGLPDDFPRGWWVGFKVHDENVWSEVRKGNRTGFSIHGKGIRKDQSVDELMGYSA